MSASAEARVRASGLFDPDYYRRIYGHWIPHGEDPLSHFLQTGLAQGDLPSTDFDPVLYRVLVPECGDENPLLHAIASGKPFHPPPLRELFPSVEDRIFSRSKLNAGLDYSHLYSKDVAVARELTFCIGDARYALKIPEAGMLIARLRADQPFAYARLPHGFWDALWVQDIGEAAIAADLRSRCLPAAQRGALALRLCGSVRSRNGAFAPSFIEEVLADIPVHASCPDFLRAVALTGFAQYDGDVIGHPSVGPPREAVLQSFSKHFRPDETLFDATLWKRMLFAGRLAVLPELCRVRPVILVASSFFGSLDARWHLSDFSHVLIPRSLSQWQRWDLYTRTREAVASACARAGRPPIVLTQCGGSLAYWLITRLFSEFPGVFYVDLGQALNGWFFDIPKIGGSTWTRMYGRTTIENSNLEHYYRPWVGPDYEAWLHALSQQRVPLLARHVDAADTTKSLVDAVRMRRPELFESRLTVHAASALLKQAFGIVRERLNDTPDGVVSVAGLGTFQVRIARTSRKVFNLITDQPRR